MPDTLCRLAVHVTGPDEATTVDLVLPAEVPSGELLPSIVDAAVGPGYEAGRWHLTRVAGAPVDAALSLRGNHIHDGDMVLLAVVAVRPPRRRVTSPCAMVAGLAGPDDDPAPMRRALLATGLAGILACAAALAWSGTVTAQPWHLWSAAAVSVAAAGTASTGGAGRPSPALLVTAAVVFAMATGVLAAPDGSWVVKSLLSSSAGCAMSILLMRVTTGDGVATAFAACTGAVATCSVFASRLDVAGAALAVLSLIALSAAPKLTVLAAGLGPSRGDLDEVRGAAAQRILTGLVAGWSVSATLGSAAVAVSAVHTPSSALATVFVADIGMLLVLRRRSHADVHRRIALHSSGFGALLIGVAMVVVSAPVHAWWICVAAAVACVAAARWTDNSGPVNPIARHSIQVAEYLALAAVVPLAFWVTGLYGVVGELSLP